MFCDNCGKSIPDNSPACGYCGQLFTAASGEAAIPAPRVSVGYPNISQPSDRGPFLVMPVFRLTLGRARERKDHSRGGCPGIANHRRVRAAHWRLFGD
jgi:hypothetical protein